MYRTNDKPMPQRLRSLTSSAVSFLAMEGPAVISRTDAFVWYTKGCSGRMPSASYVFVSFLHPSTPLFMAYNELRIVNGEHRCTTVTLFLSFRIYFQHKRTVAMPYSIAYVRVVSYFHQHPRFRHPKTQASRRQNLSSLMRMQRFFTYRVFTQTIALHITKCWPCEVQYIDLNSPSFSNWCHSIFSISQRASEVRSMQ